MGIDSNTHIGEQYGIYIIEGIADKKGKNGQVLYNGKCLECGFIAQKTLSDFKRKNVQKCTHYSKLTQEQKDLWYEKHKKKCLYCGQDIPIGNRKIADYNVLKFCSNSCATSYNNKGIRRNFIVSIDYDTENRCLNCGEIIQRRSMYCSMECQRKYEYNIYINRWKQGLEDGMSGQYQLSRKIRKYLFEKYDNKCSKCGWNEVNPYTGNIPLEVHHNDGDYTNNSEDNLSLLCPNCHSLTATYKNSNAGNGRKSRKKYNQ